MTALRLTEHARLRMQQRAIPPLVVAALLACSHCDGMSLGFRMSALFS